MACKILENHFSQRRCVECMKYISCFSQRRYDGWILQIIRVFPKNIHWLDGIKYFQEPTVHSRFASWLFIKFEGSDMNCRGVIAFPSINFSLKEDNLPQCLKSLARHRVRAVQSLGTPPHNALMVYAKNPWQSSVFGQYISDGTSPHKAFKV